MTMPGVLQGDSGLGKNAFRSTEQGAISYFVGGEGVKPQKMPGARAVLRCPGKRPRVAAESASGARSRRIVARARGGIPARERPVAKMIKADRELRHNDHR